MTRLLALSVLVGFQFLVSSATAQVCVSFGERDMLGEPDREGARALLEQELDERGALAGGPDCELTLVVTHLIVAGAFNVAIAGPEGTVRDVAASPAELGPVYSELVGRALAGDEPRADAPPPSTPTPAPPPTAPPTPGPAALPVPEPAASPTPEPVPPTPTPAPAVDPYTGVPIDRADPYTGQYDGPVYRSRRPGAPAQDIGYFRLGPGGTYADAAFSGPAIGFGWRHYEKHLAIDGSVANAFFLRNSADGFTMGILTLNFYYVQSPAEETTGYFGGGMSWGMANFCVAFSDNYEDDDTCYRGDGMQLEVGGGVEFMRFSAVRLSVHGNVSLPLGTAAPTDEYGGSRPGDPVFAPTGTIQIGVGFGQRCDDCE